MPGPQLFCGARPILLRRSFGTAPGLPKLVSECGYGLVVCGRVSAVLPCGAVFLLRLQISPIGVLQGLSGAFMSSQMIFLSVVLGAGTMGMCGIAAVLGSYLL